MGKTGGVLVMTFIVLVSCVVGTHLSKAVRKRAISKEMLDSITTSYDKYIGILKSQNVIIDNIDSLGFDNTKMLLRKTDSLLKIEKTKIERYESIYKSNR